MRFAAGFAVGALALTGLAAAGIGWLLHKLDVDLAGVRL